MRLGLASKTLTCTASRSHLDVFHVLKEVWLGVVVVRQLDEVPELFFGGEGLDEAGQHRGVIVLHALEEKGVGGAGERKLTARETWIQAETASHLGLATKTLEHSGQDGVQDDVLVGLLSDAERSQLGDHGGQTQGGVVRQRHVTDLKRNKVVRIISIM